VEHPRHPDTGAPIAGVQLPQWPAARELAFVLMDAFPELEHVGWDLAIGDGMVEVIEGNATMPDVSLLQFTGPFAGDPRLREYYTRTGLLPRR
jgi:hypothetical protein